MRSERVGLRVVPPERGGHTVEIGEQAALIHRDEIQLVAKLRHGAGGNHEARERRGKSVLLQEGVERLVLLRAERERGRLMDDARVERGRLEQAGEWLGAP